MRLDTTMTQRMDQRMILAPRMIQSMEILQLPIMALQERIQQELQENPVLELKEVSNDEDDRRWRSRDVTGNGDRRTGEPAKRNWSSTRLGTTSWISTVSRP